MKLGKRVLMKRVFQLIIIILNSWYLTEAVDQVTLDSKLQYIFVFIYFCFLCTLVVFLFNKFLVQTQRKRHSTKLQVYSLIIAIIVILIGGEGFNHHKYQATEIEIVAKGEKNISSQSTEVWITGVTVDNNEEDLHRFEHPGYWEIREDALLSTTNQPAEVKLNFPPAENINISFLKHDWSGIILIKDGQEKKEIDLYSKKSENYIYEVKSNKSTQFSVLSVKDYLLAYILLHGLTYVVLTIFFRKRKS